MKPGDLAETDEGVPLIAVAVGQNVEWREKKFRTPAVVPLDQATDLLLTSLRKCAIENWRSAAEWAEQYASLQEEANLGLPGPEACRRIAEHFTKLANNHLDVFEQGRGPASQAQAHGGH